MRWRHGAALSLAILLLIAVIAGVASAAGALGDGTRPVNVLWAVGALLGVHALTFLLWLASFLLRPGSATGLGRSEGHTSELQSLMRISYAVFCLNKKNKNTPHSRPVLNHQHLLVLHTVTT